MQTYSGSELGRSPSQERIAFNAPNVDADSGMTPNDSLGARGRHNISGVGET